VSWAIWITDPPGGGKTGVAGAAAAILLSRGVPVHLLALNAVRGLLSLSPALSRTEDELIHRAGSYVAAQLVDAGVPVIVDATLPCRRGLRPAPITRFAEVQLRCGPETRIELGPPDEPAWEPERLASTAPLDVSAAIEAVTSLAEGLETGAPAARESCPGWAIWITGRPGSGKSTVARRVAESLSAGLTPVKVLDLASARRAIVGCEWATETQEALVHRALAYATKLLTEAGVGVILDATAPRRAWRQTAREWITHFAEVQLDCPSEICAERERAVRWHLGDVLASPAGDTAARPDIVLDYEESWHPDLRLHTHAPDLTTTVDQVVQLARRLERAAHLRSTEAERTRP
jgi:adenylylsulfate kinase